MIVSEFMELLRDCYEDMEIVVDTEAIDSKESEVVGIDIDEFENMAVIRIKG